MSAALDRRSRAAESWKGSRVHTVGHSTRSFDELVALLRSFEISVLADIRTIPRSRHNPQFNADVLGAALRSKRIRYAHIAELGGLRKARPGSPNGAWRNASFRGYADHMLTEDFESGLAKLRELTARGNVALMCAEAVPWRCHRSLVADALVARGAEVEHISGVGRSSPHQLTKFAEVEGTRVTYPGEDPAGDRLVTRAPFHLQATVRVLQRRPNNRVDIWDGNARYLRALRADGGLVLVRVTNLGTIAKPDVRLATVGGEVSGAARAALEATVRRILGLDVDPRPLRRLAEAEHRLAPTARALRGMRPPRFATLFEAFASVIPFQQLSLDAGVAIVSRLVERYGDSVEHDARRFYAFPEARSVARARLDSLRRCGLSRTKAETLRRVARLIESGELTESLLEPMSSSEAIARLTAIEGIGLWSASLVLLRGMGRLDVFPPGDVGVTRGLGQLLRLAPGQSLDRIVRRFGEHRGYLYFQSLGAQLLSKGLIGA